MYKYKEKILKLIQNSKEHLSAEQIFLQLKTKNEKIVLASVYNNLSKLYQEQLIRKISIEGQPDRYDRVIKHDHLVCSCCGKITDVYLSDLTQKITEQIGMPIYDYDLQIHYLCPDCKNK